MIKIKDQLPSIYYDASRDFQILGHLYEVVLNYTKTNADMLYLLPNGIEADTRSTEMLATTLGFRLKRNYDKEQLAALVSIFPRLLKIKGTKGAVDLAGNALVKASGLPGTFTSDLKGHVLTVKIPIELSDITLFMDLLPYILPFGIRVSIIRSTAITKEAILPIGATTVVRKALPGADRHEPHPLGLARISGENDTLSVEYSNSGFVNTDNTVAVGLFGTSPIITFNPEANEPDTIAVVEEENT
jgi:hypothetical protein